MSLTLREASKDTLQAENKTWRYYSLPLAARTLGDISRLPKSLKVLLENLLRWQDGDSVTEEDIQALAGWLKNAHADREIAYRPARVLMQDFTGVPAVVDLAAMREAVKRLGGDTAKVNPLSPVDLVIDHSVTVDHFGDDDAFGENVRLEMERNHERYVFLKWGQQAFSRFSVVPPGTGICHQVNLEYLGKAVWSELQDKEWVAYPDTLVGTDSHTTMINGLGVLGWGVGGIEAEAAMLGQPVSMLIPDVVGFKLTGKLSEGITATDLVLTVTQMLRKHGVVGKFVEFMAMVLIPCRWRTGPPSPTWRRNMARPAAFSRLIALRWSICASVVAARSRWLSLRPTPKRRACGVTRVTSRYLPVRWNWIWAPLRQASQGQNVRRTASP